MQMVPHPVLSLRVFALCLQRPYRAYGSVATLLVELGRSKGYRFWLHNSLAVFAMVEQVIVLASPHADNAWHLCGCGNHRHHGTQKLCLFHHPCYPLLGF